MNDRLRKGFMCAASALVLSPCFVAIHGDNNDASNSQAAFAQAKKKPAKPAGQPKQSGPNLNNAEVNSYLSRLRDKVDQNWELPDGRNKVTLTTVVGADGVAGDVSTSSAPSNQAAEQAANEAFAKSQPMESLPASAGTKVKLTLTFESFADPHGDTNRNISSRLDPVIEPKETPPQ